MKGFRSYIDYLELKLHFTVYDFRWRYIKKQISADEKSFESRRDKKLFASFEDLYSDHRMSINHLVSGFLHEDNLWIGNVFSEEVKDYHLKRLKRISSLPHQIFNDLEEIEDFLDDRGIQPNQCFLTSGTHDPIIIKELGLSRFSLETWSLIDKMIHFTDVWFPINPLKKNLRLKIYKYSSFIPNLSTRVQSNLSKQLAHLSVSAHSA